jgi:hypothetical protein
MRALLDVNVLVALLDADHTLHVSATSWFATHARLGWASCPMTQNGCVRVMSSPAYPNAPPPIAVFERLREATAIDLHEFWADDVSLLDDAMVDVVRIHGHRQVTDVYLLALAVRRGGRLVTFDRSIARSAVRGAESRHLLDI